LANFVISVYNSNATTSETSKKAADIEKIFMDQVNENVGELEKLLYGETNINLQSE